MHYIQCNFEWNAVMRAAFRSRRPASDGLIAALRTRGHTRIISIVSELKTARKQPIKTNSPKRRTIKLIPMQSNYIVIESSLPIFEDFFPSLCWRCRRARHQWVRQDAYFTFAETMNTDDSFKAWKIIMEYAPSHNVRLFVLNQSQTQNQTHTMFKRTFFTSKYGICKSIMFSLLQEQNAIEKNQLVKWMNKIWVKWTDEKKNGSILVKWLCV